MNEHTHTSEQYYKWFTSER